jgi:hypothetical protein
MQKIKKIQRAAIWLLFPFALLDHPGEAFSQMGPGLVIAALNRSYPGGEFSHRFDLAYRRLTEANINPVFTEDFILADVNPDPANPRRFYNFSGDLSGRYIEVMSLLQLKGSRVSLPGLVNRLLTYQRKDGRFGNPHLVFSEDQIGADHMALLWGNGRLLVGLLQYYKIYKDAAVLAAAKRLGDFFLKTYSACSSPAVRSKISGFGATGIICFTQFTEGLVMLSSYTKDDKYADTAALIYPLLAERGKQHSHGYLTTLRGVLMLYNYSGVERHLAFVRKAYDDLVRSTDYTAFGSVREYFGKRNGERDEGCSIADFTLLSFELYKITGDSSYLEKGEFALFNAFYFNQYYTGDFGHHLISGKGAAPSPLYAAWWCCTMHCLWTMYEVRKNYMVEYKKESPRLNLYLDTDYKDEQISFSVSRESRQGGFHFYKMRFNYCRSSIPPMYRMPQWATGVTALINGKKAVTDIRDGYIYLHKKIAAGDVIRIGFIFKEDIVTKNGKEILPGQVTVPIKGFFHYGPYLMGDDEKIDPTFSAEPNDNIIFIKTLANTKKTLPAPIRISSAIDSYLTVHYEHGGYPSYLQTVLRPVSELTYDGHGYLTTYLSFSSAGHPETLERSKSMLEPFQHVNRHIE